MACRDLQKRAANFAPLTPLTFLDRAAAVFPNHTAVIYGSQSHTWIQVAERCRRLASSLVVAGIRPGEAVAIVAPNTPPMFECHFGVPLCGAVLVTINTRLDADTVAYILRHARVRALIYDVEFASLVASALKKLRRKPLLLEVSEEKTALILPGALDYEAKVAEGDALYAGALPTDEWDTITLNYTSGTTGRPKAVAYHYRGAYLNALNNIITWDMPHHPVYLWTLPMFHCNGWCFPWTLAALAGTSICLRRPDSSAVIDALAQRGVSHMCGAPIVYASLIEALHKLPCVPSWRVKGLVAGAAPSADLFEQASSMGIELTHVYGLTETYGPAAVCAAQADWEMLDAQTQSRKHSRQGVRSVLQEAMAVLHSDTLSPVPADGQTLGEIMFRGNIMMKGYLRDADAAEKAFAGGWFHTGDLAVLHTDGYVEIKDRAKDVIISGGENISSLEIEEVLMRHPGVFAAAVVAQPDAKWGESPCAFVELRNTEAPTGADLIAYCRNALAHFKVPRRIVFGPLPRTSTGKVQKFVLRDLAKSVAF